ncbi:4940_t:CDS:2 [Ambispora gerdemannii]|uniref:4940_t:CDS:1 n=1 Tax=Ambispora gerdemannii TaxID=144530 RepID=A0A9N8ZYM4_9GLOM|nr:4940_t:CDS:2 [Ambispora gerdemannii]
MSENNTQSQNIVLNVGGLKYETLRSTLTAYPDTLLGTMFAERNQALLKPKNGNEYFFDRNGRAFYYIMEYYRTGKLSFPTHADNNSSGLRVSRSEIESELDYFQINLTGLHTKEVHLEISKKLDEFVAFLEEQLLIKMSLMKEKVHFEVSETHVLFSEFPRKQSLKIDEYKYQLAKRFHHSISQHLRNKFKGTNVYSWLMSPSNSNNFESTVGFTVTPKYDDSLILRMSHLKIDD